MTSSISSSSSSIEHTLLRPQKFGDQLINGVSSVSVKKSCLVSIRCRFNLPYRNSGYRQMFFIGVNQASILLFFNQLILSFLLYNTTTSVSLHTICLLQFYKNSNCFMGISNLVKNLIMNININVRLTDSSRSRRAGVSSNAEVVSTGTPISVPVRVAHELVLAGHNYLDVR